MIGKPFIILSSVDSTNNHAMELIREGKAATGTAIFSLEQTSGKGQRGRNWISEPGQNIIISVILGFEGQAIRQQFLVSAVAALSCHDLLSKYAGDETCIKWPNDLFWRDRKTGGILIENLIQNGQLTKSVIGIGININQTNFDALDKKAVSLKQITGKTFDPILLAQELCEFLEKRFEKMKEDSIHDIMDEYNKRLFMKDANATFKKNQIVFEAKVLGVDSNGELEIEHGLREKFLYGEIDWVL